MPTFLQKGLIAVIMVVTWLAPAHYCNAQTALTAASGRFATGNQVHEWSVGEMCAVSTAVSPQLIVTQGFLQPQLTPVSTNESAVFFAGLKVQPNPTAATATLTGQLEKGNSTIQFELIDAKAALVLQGQMAVSSDGFVSQDFDLTAQPTGTYFLHLHTGNFHSTLLLIKL